MVDCIIWLNRKIIGMLVNFIIYWSLSARTNKEHRQSDRIVLKFGSKQGWMAFLNPEVLSRNLLASHASSHYYFIVSEFTAYDQWCIHIICNCLINFPSFSRQFRRRVCPFLPLGCREGICSYNTRQKLERVFGRTCMGTYFEQRQTLLGWEKMVLTCWHWGHLTSMKNDSGACTSCLSLCWPCSSAGSTLRRSISIVYFK